MKIACLSNCDNIRKHRNVFIFLTYVCTIIFFIILITKRIIIGLLVEVIHNLAATLHIHEFTHNLITSLNIVLMITYKINEGSSIRVNIHQFAEVLGGNDKGLEHYTHCLRCVHLGVLSLSTST